MHAESRFTLDRVTCLRVLGTLALYASGTLACAGASTLTAAAASPMAPPNAGRTTEFTGTVGAEAAQPARDELFPRKGLEDRIEFWKLVFSKYGERDVVFHDREDVRLIYEVVSFENTARGDASEALRQRRELTGKESELRGILRDLAEDAGNASLTARHQKVFNTVTAQGYPASPAVFRRLSENIRSQEGIKEKFAAGVVRSGKYLRAMEETFNDAGLPTELAMLPHIESSFNYLSRSHKGAAGIWQFMRSTGRRFMRINTSVDERLDPLKATEGAARFLRENHSLLGSWPLAITAYNHGPGGMARARRLHGDDMARIIDEYDSRSFGFASKNFYAEFLAAVDIARDADRYLGPIEIAPPLEFRTVMTNRSYSPRQLMSTYGISEDALAAYNLQVLPAVWRGSRALPAGSYLRIPAGEGAAIARAANSSEVSEAAASQVSAAQAEREAAIPAAPRARETQRTRVSASTYRVRPGDTLAGIARKFGVSMQTLQRVNDIENPQRVRAGQVLRFSERAEVREARNKYEVRRGDTLFSIARRLGVSLETILQTNDMRRGHQIYPGQILLLPPGL